jgi:hypothetical protein
LKEALATARDRRLDRRELLRGGGGLAVAAGLAGCGVGNIERGSLAETENPIRKQVGRGCRRSAGPLASATA